MDKKDLNIDFGKQEFNVGDRVNIDWAKKNYEGKSVRRKVIDDIMEEWRFNSLNNLKTEVSRNFVYKFDSTKKTLKTFNDILNGKKACESTVFKRHDEAKEWFLNIVEALDNIQGAIVVGVKANWGNSSKICPYNVCYVEAGGEFSHKPFFIYTVMVHGICDIEDRTNHIQFEVELFDEYMKLVK